jgi:cardiolipin synthase
MPEIPDLILWTAFVSSWLVLGCISAAHAIMYKRDPRSAAIWLMLSFMIPIAGPWLYWALGINRVERKAVVIIGRRYRPFNPSPVKRVFAGPEEHASAVGHLIALKHVADRVTRLPILPGNALTPMHNGEQAYPRMIQAINDAHRSVTLASYIFDRDDVGYMFADAMGEASKRGARVHLLVDGIGALKTASRMGRRLMGLGVEVAPFVPLRFPFGRVRLNLRNHRKILVVDGKTGFSGGMNISERHLVNRPRPGRSEDLHFEITGPVVSELQHCFVEDWALATGSVLEGEAYFPILEQTGSAVCRGIVSGPDEDFEKIQWMLQAAFAAAQKSVRIITPYFVPTSPLIWAMTTAALRGVEVSVLLPSVVDLPFMRWAADAYLWQLLQRGIRVFRQPPPFVHTKLLIVDDRWVFFGSANLDRRSFRLNFEFNVEVYDATLARQLAGWTDSRISRAREVTLEEVDSRPKLVRFRDGFVKLFSPHL